MNPGSSWLLLLPLAVAGAPAQAAVPPTVVPVAVTGLPAEAPLSVAARHDGKVLEVEVELKPSWHLYGRDTGGGEPVGVTLTGGAFAAAGPLELPMDDKGQITGHALLRLPLERVGKGDRLAAQMRFMVCDPLECLPPIALDLRTAPEPCRVLLVAIDAGERTQRIAAFLKERGFTVAVTTYADVTTEACDAADVVLADSPTFHDCKGQVARARGFPATAAPVVAVGFLGTELIEGQGVAMTSGYI